MPFPAQKEYGVYTHQEAHVPRIRDFFFGEVEWEIEVQGFFFARDTYKGSLNDLL